MAIGLADALEKAGINVPEDLAITGYGTIEEGRNSPKALTSSYVPGEYYGQYAVECVLEMMDGRDIKEPEYESTLFIGESCGCDGKSDVSLKREHWFTNESEAGFYSLHNTMEGDLQNCDSIDSFLAEVCEHMYNLKNIDRIDICLNDSWLNRDVPEISGFPTDGYTDRIIWAISYESDKPRDGKYGLDRSFDKKSFFLRWIRKILRVIYLHLLISDSILSVIPRSISAKEPIPIQKHSDYGVRPYQEGLKILEEPSRSKNLKEDLHFLQARKWLRMSTKKILFL